MANVMRFDVLHHCVVTTNAWVFLIMFWIAVKSVNRWLRARHNGVDVIIRHNAFVALSTVCLGSFFIGIFFGTSITHSYAYDAAQTCLAFHKLGKQLFKAHAGYDERPLLAVPLCPMTSRFHDDKQLPFPLQLHNLVANSMYSMDKLFLFWDASNVIMSIFLFYQFINHGQGQFLMKWFQGLQVFAKASKSSSK